MGSLRNYRLELDHTGLDQKLKLLAKIVQDYKF